MISPRRTANDTPSTAANEPRRRRISVVSPSTTSMSVGDGSEHGGGSPGRVRAGHQYRRSFGSKMSRRPSPSEFSPSTIRAIIAPGNHRRPERHGPVVAPLRDHGAQARRRRLGAEVDEGEACLGDHGPGDVVRGHHEHRSHDVRDHVAQQDPPIRHPEHPRRLDELSLGQRLHLGANDPREAGPEDHRDGDHDALEPLADHARRRSPPRAGAGTPQVRSISPVIAVSRLPPK